MNKTKIFLLLLFCSVFSLEMFAANKTQYVKQVTGSISVTGNVDYTITDSEPFASLGSVSIDDVENAVVIIQNIKPSKVIANWLNHVYIKGNQAVDGENCQVRMFGRGTIIFPYDKNFRPLTCYTEKNYGGKQCNDYTEGHSGGYMRTLKADQLDNQIRSFKLKRGYMVTFALGKAGWGYSRCFIADMEDLDIPAMPGNMDMRVSSYRLFKWWNAKKASLCSTSEKYCDLVNATAGFDWGRGHDMLPDVECIPNHIYEDYPSTSSIGSVTWTCHSKNNNEPGNSADDHPQTVEEVLDNWQNVMRTGLRVCSESSHDGSMGHLQAFLDSVDARGWRCDIIDMHCYWLQGQFDGLTGISQRYGNRPIWISEWLWGAWWNKNGIFAQVTDPTDFSLDAQQKLLNGTKPILEKLNANPRVERYFYWNAEERTSLWSKDGADTLSLLGKYYANTGNGLAFNRQYEYVPKVVYRASTNLTNKFDTETRTLTLRWDDSNGDMLDSMAVFCKRPGATQYERIASIELKEINSKKGASYTYVDSPLNGQNFYRVAIYPIGNKIPKFSNVSVARIISDKAKWDDVTEQYVENAGFDKVLDYVKATNLVPGVASHKKVTGWQTESTSANGVSGTFKIGGVQQLNSKSAPAKNAAGEARGGALGMNQGWGGVISYTQKIKLPAGTYRMSYAITNSLAGEFTNRSGYQVDGQQAVYDNLSKTTYGKWDVSVLEPFTLKKETEVTLILGYESAGGVSTGNAYLFFDYVKIEKGDMSDVDDAGAELDYEDVTDNYFKNPNFDLSSSWLNTDLTNGSANHKSVSGWTTSCSDANGSSGAFPVGSGKKINGKVVPATNSLGETSGGVLGISQGWEVASFYKQVVTLPAGTYRMSYAVYNAANTTSVKSRNGYQINDQAAVYDGLTTLSVGQWTIRTMEEFTLDKATPVSFTLGFAAARSTSTTNPYWFYDYIKLEKVNVIIPTGISNVVSETAKQQVGIYRLDGIRIPNLQNGINIIRYADGTTKKIIKK